MSYILKEFVKGIVLRGESSDVLDGIEGSLFHNSSDKKLKTFIDSTVREIVTTSQSQVLTNKTIDYNLNTILNFPSGGGGGVNTDLSNLTAPTAIPTGVDLISNTTSTFFVKTRNVTSGDSSQIGVSTGQVTDGSGNSGRLVLFSGWNATPTGNSGIMEISSGPALGSGTSGSLSYYTGKSVSGLSGSVFINSGPIDDSQQGIDNQLNTNPTGAIQINTGRIRNTSSTSRTGNVLLASGSSTSLLGSGNLTLTTGAIGDVTTGVPGTGTSGNTVLQSGNVNGTGSTGSSGQVSIYSGSSTSGSGNSGDVSLKSGNANSGSSGSLYVESGTSITGASGNTYLRSGSSSSGNSGKVEITTGDALNGTPGDIEIIPGISNTLNRRGNLTIGAHIMYAHSGAAILTSTLNTIITSTDIDLLNSSGTVYHHTLVNNVNLQFINGVPGKRFTVVVRNVTGSSLTVNFPIVKQKAGTIINTVAANSANIFEFVNSNNEYYCISCINNVV